MTDLNIIGVVGSLRSGSVNAATARAAAAVAPGDLELTLHNVSGIPLYDGDSEVRGVAEVATLQAVVRAADGLIFFSPEYNGSFPAVTKNVIDWLSRPPRSWEGTPLTLISTSPGPRAGKSLRDHFSTIMARQPIRLFETHGIGGYGEKLDERGELVDQAALTDLADFLARFGQFCRQEPVPV